jgi:hypothetical protein
MSLPTSGTQMDTGTEIPPANNPDDSITPSSVRARVVFAENHCPFPAQQMHQTTYPPVKSTLKNSKVLKGIPDKCSSCNSAAREGTTGPVQTSAAEARDDLLQSILTIESLPGEINDMEQLKTITDAYKTLHSGLCAPGRGRHQLDRGKNYHQHLSVLREHQQPFVHALIRDIMRATETPRRTARSSPDKSYSNINGVQKTIYETDAQAQWAREEYGASLAATKLVEDLFHHDNGILSGELFKGLIKISGVAPLSHQLTEDLLSKLISALLSLTKTATLHGYGSGKIRKIAMRVLESLSALFQSTTGNSSHDIATSIISPHTDAISISLTRGILTSSDEKWRQTVVNSSLRAVIQFLTSNPHLFKPAFFKSLSTVLIQELATCNQDQTKLTSNAIRCVAWASIQENYYTTATPVFHFDMPVSTPGATRKHVKLALTRISGLFQDLNASSRTAESSKELVAGQTANCVWSLATLASLFVLIDNWLSDTFKRGEPLVSEQAECGHTNPVEYLLSLTHIATHITSPLSNGKPTEIRDAAIATLRVLLWVVLRHLERTHVFQEPIKGASQNHSINGDRMPTTAVGAHNHHISRNLWLNLGLTFNGVGIAIVCATLHSPCGGADRASRLESALEVLLAMAGNASTAIVSIEILQHMLTATLPVGNNSKPREDWHLSLLLPHSILNDCLQEDVLLAAVSTKMEQNFENTWMAYITPISAVEAEQRWGRLWDIWSAAFLKEHLSTNRSEISLVFDL